MPETKPFDHRHAAHCESGTMSGLLRNRGLDLSEPMVFGIGGGLFFIFIPFIKMGGIPLTAYRITPGGIIKNCCKRLGVSLRTMRFRGPGPGTDALDRLVTGGTPVGLRTSVFWLPYFPKDMRFQFNAHHLIVYGKEGDDYLISDPVFEHTVRCPAQELRKARFTKGLFAPKGYLFYPEDIPPSPDVRGAVRTAILATAKRMLGLPLLPFIGVRGIRYMANQMKGWPEKLGEQGALSYVGSVVRMQEEIGTGGAGFRFMYTAFLQEAAELLGNAHVKEAARMMGDAGDEWRNFAVKGARACKEHRAEPDGFKKLSDIVTGCAQREEKIYRLLKEKV